MAMEHTYTLERPQIGTVCLIDWTTRDMNSIVAIAVAIFEYHIL